MGWPPKVGELLPRAEEAFGVRRKLARYSLDQQHPWGRSKALGFELVLGITIEEIHYLKAEILAGILDAPIASVRHNPPYGVNCVVEFPLRGIGDRRERAANLRTIWEFASSYSRPRLVNAFLKI